jgi:hypothetical protein
MGGIGGLNRGVAGFGKLQTRLLAFPHDL